MGGRSKAATKPKISMISGPMDVKHVGGVSIMGHTGLDIDHYFTQTSLEPDEVPSHTFVATGKTEIKRSGTIGHAIRRPSMSLKDSATHTRSKSISHHPEAQQLRNHYSQSQAIARSDSVTSSQPLRIRPSISRLRRRVGLDKDVSATAISVPSAEASGNNRQAQTDHSPLNVQTSRAYDTVASSIHSTASDHVPMSTGATSYRQTPPAQWPLPSTQQHSLLVQHKPRRTNTTASRPPARPHRADSGTAIAMTDDLNKPRPIPFKEIMAVDSFAERMKLYEKTRTYWAYADHGLVDWTGRAAAPKPAAYHDS
ncbi:hypothetical protein T440DRAFT_292047 [Plenodomus tracheiphilus IPT5]|uniref:Uncharacterized protein n=1 Tax=Plenodomus tracheiphilus IPT5 TaxID=1408161 RepID=A0A6A7BGM6_9PLEO|nr:hypothetical protein T440DRAFT_292047 [Plenodomus tracheiphilus IPT5]